MADELNYQIVIHRCDEGETGYWVEIPAFGGATQGETIDECVAMAREVIEMFLEHYAENQMELPPSDVDAGADVIVPVSVAAKVA